MLFGFPGKGKSDIQKKQLHGRSHWVFLKKRMRKEVLSALNIQRGSFPLLVDTPFGSLPPNPRTWRAGTRTGAGALLVKVKAPQHTGVVSEKKGGTGND